MVRLMADRMLTTVDNPFDPRIDFDQWYQWDTRSGYNTLALLGRIVRTSDDLSEADQEHAIDLAMDEIVRENVSGMHKIIDD